MTDKTYTQFIREAASDKITLILNYSKRASYGTYANRTITSNDIKDVLKRLDKFFKENSRIGNAFVADKVEDFYLIDGRPAAGVNMPNKELTKKHSKAIQKIIDQNKSVKEASDMKYLKLNSRVSVPDDQRGLEYGQYQLGSIVFGRSSVARALVVDRGIAEDQRIAGTKLVARIANLLTKISGGNIGDATLAKFNLEKGTMWLARDEDENGKIIWGKGFKFKHLAIQNLDKAREIGWIGKNEFI